MKHSISIVLAAAIGLAGVSVFTCRSASGAGIEKPEFEFAGYRIPDYGDQESVDLLAGLLADADPLTRQQATRDLGWTNNHAAFVPLKKALLDKAPAVRVAAVAAAVELGGDSAAEFVVKALGAKEPAVCLAGIYGAARLRVAKAAEKLGPIARDASRPRVRAAALTALTELGLAAPESTLKKALADAAVVVRLAAARNTLQLKKADGLIAVLMQLAEKDPVPAVRAGVLPVLGKFAAGKAGNILRRVSKNPNPLIRRGAVLAYHNARQNQRIPEFLEDEVSIVRLAAIVAAGDLKITSTRNRLMALMLEAPDEQTHLAAREALLRIAAADTPQNARKQLAELLKEFKEVRAEIERLGKEEAKAKKKKKKKSKKKKFELPVAKRKYELIERNGVACCRIIGEMKYRQACNFLLKHLDELPLDSPVLGEAAWALGKLDDLNAVGPLMALLEKCRKRGIKYFKALVAMRAAPPYSPIVTGRVIRSLGDLKARKAVAALLRIPKVDVQGMRMNHESAEMIRAMGQLECPENREKFRGCVLEILSDEGLKFEARFSAAVLAARWKMSKALQTLRQLLTEERPGPMGMQLAGWAIQEISGKTPEIPEPYLKKGPWILTQTGK
ncbi:MAG: HEAT repeat domain-containing protein [Phycisphaerae bacterium]|nr:HEAT repeat domain-containing protein [Phycisphaerae bacterium]